MQMKNKKKSKKGKEKTQKNVQNKMGSDLELAFFYTPWI
jgi:hypothetical protein